MLEWFRAAGSRVFGIAYSLGHKSCVETDDNYNSYA